MTIIRVANLVPNVRENPKTFTTQNVDAGDTTVEVIDVSGFNDDTFLQFGDTGTETAELALNSNVASSPITVTALVNPHAASTPVYEVEYDQLKIYRLRSAVETLIATIDLQVNAPYTAHKIPDALAGDAYATSFLNSDSGNESPKSEYMEVAGYDHNSKRGLIVRGQEMYDDLNEQSVTSKMWGDWANEGIIDLSRAVEKKDQGYQLRTVVLDEPSDLGENIGTSFALPDDFKSAKNVWIKYETDWLEARIEDLDSADPSKSGSTQSPSWSYQGDNLIIKPYLAIEVRLTYYPVTERLVNDYDTPPNPMRFYDDAILDYMMLRAAQRKRDKEMIPVFFASYRDKKAAMVEEIARRNKGRMQGLSVSSEWVETRDQNHYI